MSELLRFDTMPPMGLYRAAMPRRARYEGAMPPLAAELPEVALTLDDRYRRLCGIPEEGAVPICWPQVFAGPLHLAVLTHPAFPLPAMGIVHVKNRIEQLQPLHVGDKVRIRCALGEARFVKHGLEFDLHTEFFRGQTLVWRASTTALSRAVRGAGGKDAGARNHGGAGAGDGPPFRTMTRTTTWRVRADLGRRYAAISGDRNPIHLYPITARLFGFKRPIIHGMWTLARSLAELQDDVPAGPVAVEVFFRRPVMLPSTVLFASAPVERGLGFRVTTRDGKKVHLWGVVEAVR